MKKVLRLIDNGSIPNEVILSWCHHNCKDLLDHKALLSYQLVSRVALISGLFSALLGFLLYLNLNNHNKILSIALMVVFTLLTFFFSAFFKFVASKTHVETLKPFTKDLQFFVGLARYVQINMGEYSIETILKEDVQKRILRLGARELNTIEKFSIDEYLSILQNSFLTKILNYQSDDDDSESLAARVLRITMIFGLKLP